MDLRTGGSLLGAMCFYNQVLRRLKPKGIDLDEFYRLFPVPGLQYVFSLSLPF